MIMEGTQNLEGVLLAELDSHCSRYLELRTQLKTPGLAPEVKVWLEAELTGVITLLESSAEQYSDL